MRVFAFFCLLFVFTSAGYAQEQENNPTEYPYGGEIDSNRYKFMMRVAPLNFKSLVQFTEVTFNDRAQFGIATFSDSTIFWGTTFNDTTVFWAAEFNSIANFGHVKFINRTEFGGTTFKDEAYLGRSVFSGFSNFSFASFSGVSDFSYAVFTDTTFFEETSFNDIANFQGVTFKEKSDFEAAKFDSIAYFLGAIFGNITDFTRTSFESTADFGNAKFKGYVSFRSCFFNVTSFANTVFLGGTSFKFAMFKLRPNFEGSQFGDSLSFTSTIFEQGVDFRRSNFDSVTTILADHNTAFPNGEFFIYWDQFKGGSELKIQLGNALQPSDTSTTKEVIQIATENFQRIETFYHRLRDNFLAQGNQASADDVMYELQWQYDEIVGGFWWGAYGIFFGWGYESWRFLFFLVLPIVLIFSWVWYRFYYGIVLQVVNENAAKEVFGAKTLIYLAPEKSYGISRLLKNAKTYQLRNLRDKIPRITRLWHVIYFSAAVLTGIRIKTVWLKVKINNELPGINSFVWWVTFQWALGIGLYILFAVLVNGSKFGLLKGLLGLE